ncbi:hypothetical protein SLA2020_487760 [Shorea laevis]
MFHRLRKLHGSRPTKEPTKPKAFEEETPVVVETAKISNPTMMRRSLSLIPSRKRVPELLIFSTPRNKLQVKRRENERK